MMEVIKQLKHPAPLEVLDYLWKSIKPEEEQQVNLIAITVGLKDTLLVIALNPDALANFPMPLSAACLITSPTMTKRDYSMSWVFLSSVITTKSTKAQATHLLC